jgi:hypothetical protein
MFTDRKTIIEEILYHFFESMWFCGGFLLWKESLNIDDKKFHQFQYNKL